jgi:hypothetical protein
MQERGACGGGAMKRRNGNDTLAIHQEIREEKRPGLGSQEMLEIRRERSLIKGA